jgi:hypothetical protein
MHVLWISAVFVVVIFLAAAFALVWVFVKLMELTFRILGALFGGSRRSSRQLTIGSLCCPRRGCQAVNPTSAQYCRRCGHRLGAARRMRQVAVW